MGYSLDDKLVLGISSRALFNLDAANQIYEREGLNAYKQYQRSNEWIPLEPGTAMPLVRALLAMNRRAGEALAEVIVISRNDADSGLRIFNSLEAIGLNGITRGAFTDGRDPWRYLQAFSCSLFLSMDSRDVSAALAHRVPAALVLAPPSAPALEQPREVRIAFDGDAVIFGPESELIYQTEGLDAFQRHEAELADEPMSPGPFEPFLRALARIQDHFRGQEPAVRTALVTARNAPAHRRVVNTLRTWAVDIDETFFLGGVEKAGIIAAFEPHIFFDDQMAHLSRTQDVAPCAQVLPLPTATAPVSTSRP